MDRILVFMIMLASFSDASQGYQVENSMEQLHNRPFGKRSHSLNSVATVSLSTWQSLAQVNLSRTCDKRRFGASTVLSMLLLAHNPAMKFSPIDQASHSLVRSPTPAASRLVTWYSQNRLGSDLAMRMFDEVKQQGQHILGAASAKRPQMPTVALSRQAFLSSIAATVANVFASPAAASFEGAEWPLWPALPLAPYGKRKTIRREVLPGRIWTFEQLFGVFYVHVPIRMTVVRMDRGLFVYAPVAPTKECLSLLQPLIDEHGPVRYIVLPSVAPEHKVLAGPFARKFPSAQLYVTDKQYSFPLNLPKEALGFPSKLKTLPMSSTGTDLWDGEFEHEVLTAKASKESVYQEAAFFHKPSKTLLLCDAVLSVGVDPPPILTSEPEYRRALLYHARDDPLERVEDTPEVWRKGWQRIALFANFFMPGSLVKLDNSVWLPAAPKSPMPELGWAGILPFTWRESTPRAFDAFRDDGKPVVVPIIQIIYSRSPEAATRWLDKVTSWDFKRIVPAHFDAPIAAGPKELAAAFDFLRSGRNDVRFCDEDVQFLRDALEGLPPNLALFDTPLGPIRGKTCNL